MWFTTSKILIKIGKTIHPLTLKGAAAIRSKEFTLTVKGKENIPENSAVIFVAPHQTHQDVATCMEAIGKYVRPLAAIDGASTKFDKFLLRLQGTIWTLRGSSEKAKTQQHAARQAMIQALRNGENLLAFPEGTYCPIFNGMLQLWKGSAIEAAQQANAQVIPMMEVYSTDANGNITSCNIEIYPPFDYSNYASTTDAAAALRSFMLTKKQAMNAKYNLNMDQKAYSLFRKTQYAKFPWDHDFYHGATYTMDWKLDREAAEQMFKEN